MLGVEVYEEGEEEDTLDCKVYELAPQNERADLIITIDQQDRVFINDFQVTVDGLGEKLKKILEGRSDREVFLKADKDRFYGTVVRVMAEIKDAGVDKLGLVTEPEAFEKEGQKKKSRSK